MDLEKWNRYAGGLGAFAVSAAGLLLMVYFRHHPMPPSVTATADASWIASGVARLTPAIGTFLVNWLPIALILLGIAAGGAMHWKAAQLQRDSSLRTVHTDSTRDWHSSIQVVGRQIIFNLKNKQWGPPRDSGFVSCVVQDPAGSARVASEPFSVKLAHDTGVFFVYPKDFVGATDIANGEYRIRWEVRETPVGTPDNVAEDSTIIKDLEPAAAPPPAPSVPSAAEVHNLTGERDQLRKALEETQADRERIRGLLGGAEQAFFTCKRQFALARLIWFSQRVGMNIARARERGEQVEDIHVTIRFAVYDDTALVTTIKKTIEEHANWAVDLDGSNKPTLMPHPEFKVIFESGLHGTFDEVADIFNTLLQDTAVGRRAADRLDSAHLVIEVHPTLKA
jgi:hypothetical protein